MNLQEHSSAHDCPSPRNSSIPPRPLPAAVTSALTRGPRCLPRFQQLHRNLHGQTAQRPGHLRDPAGLRGPRGLDVGAVPAAVGRPAAPPGHPRQPRHHELQPEPGVTRVPHAAQSAARPQQGAALRHAARGAAVGGHADAGRGWAAGRGRALLGPVRGAHAGRRGAEPALRAHGVLGRAGGGRTHGRLRVAGAAPTRGRGPGVQGLRGAQRGAARLPGRLRGQHLRGAAVPPRGDPHAAAAVGARPAGPGVLRGRGGGVAAPGAVARPPPLDGRRGEGGGAGQLPGQQEELRPPRLLRDRRHRPQPEAALGLRPDCSGRTTLDTAHAGGHGTRPQGARAGSTPAPRTIAVTRGSCRETLLPQPPW
ncbi:PI-PLC X domain-containing protein 1 isoform X2 [Cavia porcellus]|uniref:PI-PLC X domain-containing protein 1 isoform X2 n=1 Tax=Cavia porcellus TaxID=10141 RepID=UPI002FE08626